MKNKIKINNHPTHFFKKLGKGYFDYLKIEFDRGKLSEADYNYWRRQNDLHKKEQHSMPNCSRAHNGLNKSIPYNA